MKQFVLTLQDGDTRTELTTIETSLDELRILRFLLTERLEAMPKTMRAPTMLEALVTIDHITKAAEK